MENYDLDALVKLLINSAGMRRTLETLIRQLKKREDAGEDYIRILYQDLQATLDCYEKRYETSAE